MLPVKKPWPENILPGNKSEPDSILPVKKSVFDVINLDVNEPTAFLESNSSETSVSLNSSAPITVPSEERVSVRAGDAAYPPDTQNTTQIEDDVTPVGKHSVADAAMPTVNLVNAEGPNSKPNEESDVSEPMSWSNESGSNKKQAREEPIHNTTVITNLTLQQPDDMEQQKLEAPITETLPSSTNIEPQSSPTDEYMNSIDDQVQPRPLSYPSESVDEMGDHEYNVDTPAVSESYVLTPRDQLTVLLPADISIRAKTLLQYGCMPLLPPARRNWAEEEVIVLPSSLPVSRWPPKGWLKLSPDSKLLIWETVATTLAIHDGMELDRGDVLDTFNFLALPGSRNPHFTAISRPRDILTSGL